MRRTKDQRDLEEVLATAREARDIAYKLFGRRLDTQRNVNSFILLRDSFVQVKKRVFARGGRESGDKVKSPLWETVQLVVRNSRKGRFGGD